MGHLQHDRVSCALLNDLVLYQAGRTTVAAVTAHSAAHRKPSEKIQSNLHTRANSSSPASESASLDWLKPARRVYNTAACTQYSCQ